jgi:hypothetical protein
MRYAMSTDLHPSSRQLPYTLNSEQLHPWSWLKTVLPIVLLSQGVKYARALVAGL